MNSIENDQIYYDSDLRKIDGMWKLTRLDVKHSLPVFMG